MEEMFSISVEDVQEIAVKKIKRKLTIDELYKVRKGIQSGLQHWTEIVVYAIDEVVDKGKTKEVE